MHKFSIIVLLVFVAISCNTDPSESVKVPDDIKLDLDEDGNIDFNLLYTLQTTGDPAGNYKEVKLRLESDQNQILKSEGDLPIFLDDIDLVQDQVLSPLFWEITNPSSNRIFPIASIRTDYDETTWNPKWTVFSNEENKTYLLGFKLFVGAASMVGYIEFSIDLDNGEFLLINTVFV